MTEDRYAAADRLTAWLTERTGSRVEPVFAPPERASAPGWRLRWTDGPTIAEMRALLDEYEQPGEPPECSRELSAHGRVVAVLLWLDRDPARGGDPEELVLDCAAAAIGYPERAQPRWQHRARKLRALAEGRRGFPLPAIPLLLHRCLSTGWAETLAWLDGLEHGPPRHLRVVR